MKKKRGIEVKISIGKKHIYLIALLMSLLFILLIYAQTTNNVDTSSPYHFLQQIAKGPSATDLEKMDKDNDGIIDTSEFAYKAGSAQSIVDGKDGYDIKDFIWLFDKNKKLQKTCDFAIKAINDDGSVVCTDSSQIPSTGGGGLTGKIKEGYLYMHHVRKPSATEDVGFKPSEIRFDITLYNCGVQNAQIREKIGKEKIDEIEKCGGGFCGQGLAGPLKCEEYTTTGSYSGDNPVQVPADNESQSFKISETLYSGLNCTYKAGLSNSEMIEGVCFGNNDASPYGTAGNLMGKAQIVNNGFSIEFQDRGWGGAPILVHYIARG